MSPYGKSGVGCKEEAGYSKEEEDGLHGNRVDPHLRLPAGQVMKKFLPQRKEPK